MIFAASLEKTRSEVVVALSDDNKAVMLKQLSTTALMIKTVYENVREGALTEGFASTALSLLENQLRDLSEMTGVPCQTAAEVAERSANLRAANDRCYELEKQIGAAAASTDMRLAVAHYIRVLRAWWQRDGLGFIQEAGFTADGILQAKLSGMLMPPGSFMSSTPETDKVNAEQWKARLRERGFELSTKGLRDYSVIDSPSTRKALDAVVAALPSAVISEVLCFRGANDHFTIRSIEILIRHPTDVLALGVEPTDDT